jgi:hypothetical protein
MEHEAELNSYICSVVPEIQEKNWGVSQKNDIHISACSEISVNLSSPWTSEHFYFISMHLYVLQIRYVNTGKYVIIYRNKTKRGENKLFLFEKTALKLGKYLQFVTHFLLD